jgi:predicted transposase YdaD
MYETDMISDLLTAEEKGEIRGIAKGRAEGEAKGKAEIIALLEKGLSLEEIKKTLQV